MNENVGSVSPNLKNWDTKILNKLFGFTKIDYILVLPKSIIFGITEPTKKGVLNESDFFNFNKLE